MPPGTPTCSVEPLPPNSPPGYTPSRNEQGEYVLTFDLPADGGVVVDAGEITQLGKETPPGFQKR